MDLYYRSQHGIVRPITGSCLRQYVDVILSKLGVGKWVKLWCSFPTSFRVERGLILYLLFTDILSRSHTLVWIFVLLRGLVLHSWSTSWTTSSWLNQSEWVGYYKTICKGISDAHWHMNGFNVQAILQEILVIFFRDN